MRIVVDLENLLGRIIYTVGLAIVVAVILINALILGLRIQVTVHSAFARPNHRVREVRRPPVILPLEFFADFTHGTFYNCCQIVDLAAHLVRPR